MIYGGNGDKLLYLRTMENGNDLSIRGGNVGIGTMTPKAKLDAKSTTSGFVPPRMTDAQMRFISSPPKGLVVYNKDEAQKKHYYYDGDNRKPLGGDVFIHHFSKSGLPAWGVKEELLQGDNWDKYDCNCSRW